MTIQEFTAKVIDSMPKDSLANIAVEATQSGLYNFRNVENDKVITISPRGLDQWPEGPSVVALSLSDKPLAPSTAIAVKTIQSFVSNYFVEINVADGATPEQLASDYPAKMLANDLLAIRDQCRYLQSRITLLEESR